MSRATFPRLIRRVLERLQEHERRIAGSQWHGRVSEVDAEKSLIRVTIGKDDDGNDVLSSWLPVSQQAGALKIHSLPSVGQTVALHSPDGDIEQAVAAPFSWNKDNASPSQSADEHVLTLGHVTVNLTGGGIVLSVGGVSISITGGGLAVTGGNVSHDGKNIGKDHKHGGVVPGGAQTGDPA